ncbi:MAG: hypothetical protein J7K31_01280 [Candidatus Aenigmarchaeota archaeon]|nr:hypothetical protein [Candidatus Aenigmarchaeota archaeon]
MRRKGAIQMDYILAIGIFLLMFSVLIVFSANYLQTMKNTLSVSLRRGTATDLLESITSYDSSWNYSNVFSYPSKLGLKTDMYRFFVLVNNSQNYLKNQSGSLTALTNELVEINKTAFGFSFDENSILILDENGNSVGYNISGDNIIFNVNVSINEARWFTVYFDDDSNFTDQTSFVNTSLNNITEVTYPLEKINVIQYKKVYDLNLSNYTAMKSALGLDYDFHIRLYNESGDTFLDYATGYDQSEIPERGNVIALQRPIIYQYASSWKISDIKEGKIVVYVFS